jgi:hypothetical protein
MILTAIWFVIVYLITPKQYTPTRSVLVLHPVSKSSPLRMNTSTFHLFVCSRAWIDFVCIPLQWSSRLLLFAFGYVWITEEFPAHWYALALPSHACSRRQSSDRVQLCFVCGISAACTVQAQCEVCASLTGCDCRQALLWWPAA